MAIGSGLGSQIGFGKETTWGTAVAPTSFVPVSGFNIKRAGNKVQGQGIRPNGLGELGSLYAETHEGGTASANFEVPTSGLDRIFENLTGASPTPAALGSAYQATFALADNYGKGLTVEGGKPEQDGTVQRHRLSGGKVTALEFSISVGGLLTASVEIDGKQATYDATAVTTPSFADPLGVFPWNTGSFNIDSTPVSGVRSFSIRFQRGYDTERYVLGGGATKLEQITNQFVQVSGSVTVDLLDTALLDYVKNDTDVALDIEFDRTISATLYELDLIVPSIRFQEYDVPVSGPDTLKQTLSFMGKDDGSNPLFSIRRSDANSALD